MDINKFEKDMIVFSFKQHQDTLTYLKLLKINNWTVKDIEIYVNKIKEEKTKELRLNKTLTKKCLICLTYLNLFSVNDHPSTQTGDDSKSVWYCPKCMETIYNKESVNTITRGASPQGG